VPGRRAGCRGGWIIRRCWRRWPRAGCWTGGPRTRTRCWPVSEATGPGTDLRRFAAEAAALTGPINDFFDQVLVMADDPAVKASRLGLLATVYHLAGRYLDWEQLP
jgi:hypothetical protein